MILIRLVRIKYFFVQKKVSNFIQSILLCVGLKIVNEISPVVSQTTNEKNIYSIFL
jgi:hypothetical protein